jgi:hypothetical protein
MSLSSSDLIVLSDAQRQVLLARARETSGSIATWCVPGLCWPPPTACPMPQLGVPWVSVMTPFASGDTASAGMAWAVCAIAPARDDRADSPLR